MNAINIYLDNLTKAGFDSGQTRDSSGRWSDKWSGMRNDEQRIKDQKKETALMYDNNGVLLKTINGSETHVEINNPPRGMSVLTHNHPNSSSFSRADLHFLLNNDLDSIRAIGPDGNVFEMTAKDHSNISSWRLNEAWEKAKGKADREVSSYLLETLGNDWETPYFRDNNAKKKAAQKVFGRWSDRVNYHLANNTDFGDKYFIYKTIKE
jgi:hypothetical protein